MKRSDINAMIRDADAFLRAHQFHLPPFAYWGPDDWRRKGPEAAEIVERQLGWDITDFGWGDFENTGLLVFTIRNGDPAKLKKGAGKTYAEKMLMVRCRPGHPRCISTGQRWKTSSTAAAASWRFNSTTQCRWRQAG